MQPGSHRETIFQAPSACGCGRKKTPHKTANGSVVSVGLNDACYRVWPGNYERFLTQLDVDSTSFGVWRVGPKDEIFGRYARVVAQKAGSSTGTLFFKVTDNVFESTSAAYARVGIFQRTGIRSVVVVVVQCERRKLRHRRQCDQWCWEPKQHRALGRSAV